MDARTLLEHFLSRADWVDRGGTVDRILAGDPDADFDRCVVTWIPSLAALRRAVERGARLVVCHEPVFWQHRDDRPGDDPRTADKVRYIEEQGLVVLRLHDTWDRWPGVGIPWAWARFLGLEGEPARIGAGGYMHRYDVAPAPLEEFAAGVARRCAAIGEPLVQVTGDPSAVVSRIGVGTGCACDIETFLKMGCDCSVVCDDGSCYWGPIQRAEDVGHAVVRVNHGTSEEPGMATLARYINGNVDGLRAEHIPHGSTFRLVGK